MSKQVIEIEEKEETNEREGEGEEEMEMCAHIDVSYVCSSSFISC